MKYILPFLILLLHINTAFLSAATTSDAITIYMPDGQKLFSSFNEWSTLGEVRKQVEEKVKKKVEKKVKEEVKKLKRKLKEQGVEQVEKLKSKLKEQGEEQVEELKSKLKEQGVEQVEKQVEELKSKLKERGVEEVKKLKIKLKEQGVEQVEKLKSKLKKQGEEDAPCWAPDKLRLLDKDENVCLLPEQDGTILRSVLSGDTISVEYTGWPSYTDSPSEVEDNPNPSLGVDTIDVKHVDSNLKVEGGPKPSLEFGKSVLVHAHNATMAVFTGKPPTMHTSTRFEQGELPGATPVEMSKGGNPQDSSDTGQKDKGNKRGGFNPIFLVPVILLLVGGMFLYVSNKDANKNQASNRN